MRPSSARCGPVGEQDAAFVGPPRAVGEQDPGFVGPPRALAVRTLRLLGHEIAPGERLRLDWTISETFAGEALRTAVHVLRGAREGPVLCLTAAVHGDELNGVEVDPPPAGAPRSAAGARQRDRGAGGEHLRLHLRLALLCPTAAISTASSRVRRRDRSRRASPIPCSTRW
ncbi:MAG: hypothetical protein RML12_05580 [Xanthomonadales bacterium]|nr:hypothetical protein [Xanthomonadales bacterium]